MDQVEGELTEIFRDLFDDPELELRDDMIADDVEEWDSLNHVKLVVAIEERFDVKFSNREIGSWQNVGDMRRALLEKLEG